MIDSLRIGGAESQFAETVSRLDPARFEVTVCLLSEAGPLARRLDLDRIRSLVVLEKRGRSDVIRLVRDLARLIRRERPAIVHAWLWYSTIVSTLALQFARLDPRPRFMVSQRCAYERMFEGEGRLVGSARRLLTAIRDRIADRILVNASAVGHRLASRLPDGTRRIRIVFNGIDPDRVRPRVGPIEFDLCAVGRLTPQKGLDVLVEALAILGRGGRIAPSLAVLGEGPLSDHLRDRARSLGIADRVRFLGFQDDVHAWIDRARILVLPSLYEGLPNVVMEAMALGKPVVASDVDGVADLVVPERTGLVVPPEDPTALAGAIERLLRDPETARRMGVEGRRRIEERFRFETCVGRHRAIYDELSARCG